MIACVDVDYRDPGAVAACLLFAGWSDPATAEERVARVERVEPYQPGQFYKRELPCLMAVLRPVLEGGASLEAVVVDSYVWLADEQRPGMGAHLYEALGRKVPVIGVAKTRFASALLAVEVVRGDSDRPLFVTAAGMDAAEAGKLVQSMHGPYRLPTLLKRVDQLCRTAEG
jgi:deoxyribonuclease V